MKGEAGSEKDGIGGGQNGDTEGWRGGDRGSKKNERNWRRNARVVVVVVMAGGRAGPGRAGPDALGAAHRV